MKRLYEERKPDVEPEKPSAYPAFALDLNPK
jgi:hypothetical protein